MAQSARLRATVTAPVSEMSAAPPPTNRARSWLSAALVALGFASLAWTRLNLDIIPPATMLHGIGISYLASATAAALTPISVVAAGLAEPFMGRLADRIGRLSLTLGVAGFSLFGVLTALIATGPAMLAFRVLFGVFQGLFIAASLAFAGTTFERRRGLALAVLVGMFTVGSSINPPLTRALFDGAGGAWEAPSLVYGITGFGLTAAMLAVGLGGPRDRSLIHADTAPALWRSRFGGSMFWLVLTMVCWGLTQYAFLSSYATYLRHVQNFALDAAALATSTASWLAVGLTVLIGWASDRLGRRRVLLCAGSIATLVALPLFTLGGGFWPAVMLGAIFQASNGSFLVLGVACAQDTTRGHRIGARSGLTVGTGHVMSVVGAGITPSFSASYGFPVVGAVLGVLCAVMTACLLLAMLRDPRQRVAEWGIGDTLALPLVGAVSRRKSSLRLGTLGGIGALVTFLLPWTSCQTVFLSGADLASSRMEGWGNPLLWLVPVLAAGLLLLVFWRSRIRAGKHKTEARSAATQVVLGGLGMVLGLLAILGIFGARNDPRLGAQGEFVKVEPAAWLNVLAFGLAALGGFLRGRRSGTK